MKRGIRLFFFSGRASARVAVAAEPANPGAGAGCGIALGLARTSTLSDWHRDRNRSGRARILDREQTDTANSGQDPTRYGPPGVGCATLVLATLLRTTFLLATLVLTALVLARVLLAAVVVRGLVRARLLHLGAASRWQTRTMPTESRRRGP